MICQLIDAVAAQFKTVFNKLGLGKYFPTGHVKRREFHGNRNNAHINDNLVYSWVPQYQALLAFDPVASNASIHQLESTVRLFGYSLVDPHWLGNAERIQPYLIT